LHEPAFVANKNTEGVGFFRFPEIRFGEVSIRWRGESEVEKPVREGLGAMPTVHGETPTKLGSNIARWESFSERLEISFGHEMASKGSRKFNALSHARS
jgi:hypothetical protein